MTTFDANTTYNSGNPERRNDSQPINNSHKTTGYRMYAITDKQLNELWRQNISQLKTIGRALGYDIEIVKRPIRP